MKRGRHKEMHWDLDANDLQEGDYRAILSNNQEISIAVEGKCVSISNEGIRVTVLGDEDAPTWREINFSSWTKPLR